MNILVKFLLIFLLIAGVFVFATKDVTSPPLSILPIISPTPFNPFPYIKPQIPKKRSYLTVLIGDSNTEVFGVNANQLRLDLIALYPNNEFVNYNYGFGSTNIESLPDRLTKETKYKDANYPAILSQGFDLIIIESFAYNPLSHYTLEEGLKKHEEILDDSIKKIIQKNPKAVIALMTPIAPSRQNFAKNTHNLSQEQRNQWIDERLAYIKKHKDYAKSRNLPLIDVYQKSLNSQGDGDLKYINKTDYIHPSKEGIELISKTIADFIYQENIFPKE